MTDENGVPGGRRWPWILFGLIATVPVFFAVGSFVVDSGLADPPGGAAISSSRAQTEAELQGPAPELELERADGSVLALADFEGEPLLLHFWATWCLPCIEELPLLLDFARDSPVEVLAVSVDRDWAMIRDFLGGEDGARAVLRADPIQAGEAFAMPGGLPTTFGVDAAGELVFRWDGPRAWGSRRLESALDRLSNP